MKKFLILGMCLIISASLMTGCGKDDDDSSSSSKNEGAVDRVETAVGDVVSGAETVLDDAINGVETVVDDLT